MNSKVTKFATAGALATLVAATAFAAPQQADNGRYDRNRNRDQQQQTQQTQQQDQQQWNRGSNRDNQSYDRNRNRDQQQPQQTQRQDQQQWNRGSSRDNQSYDRRQTTNDRSYGRQSDNRGYGREATAQSYRENQRYNASGRVTSYSRERGGYRVYLDGGRNSYWIPEGRLGGHSLRVGIDISLGGIFRGGMIDVDAINWPGAYGYDGGGMLRGVIERVDYRDGFATLRDERTGRMVDVRLGYDTQQLRRGDFVTLEGHWDRGDVFDASRIDDVR